MLPPRMGVSPLAAGESPQEVGARLPSYPVGGPGWALDFNPRLGLAPGRAGEWPRGRRGRNSPGPRARGVTQGVGLGGRCRRGGGQVGTEAPEASFAAPWSGWGFAVPCLSFPLYNETGVLPSLDVRRAGSPPATPPHPTPHRQPNPRPGLFHRSVGRSGGDTVGILHSDGTERFPRQKGAIRNLIGAPLTGVREHGRATGGPQSPTLHCCWRCSASAHWRHLEVASRQPATRSRGTKKGSELCARERSLGPGCKC